MKKILKIAAGVLLVIYVIQSRMVDFNSLGTVLFNPMNLLVSFLFMSFSVICCAARWFYLARAQELSFSIRRLVEITMIGSFFNTFMPGSVGGDLIKAWYVAGAEPQRKTKAIFTVILDRAVGLSVILFYAAFTLLFYQEWLPNRPELQALGYSLWAFTGGAVLFSLLFFSPIRIPGLDRLLQFCHRFKPIAAVVDATLLYRNHLRTIAVALILSIISIFGITCLYGIQGTALGVELKFPYYFFVVPIGITVSAVPLLPGGIGVGQVAFFSLFQWIGYSNPQQGATLCTLMQVYYILFNCTGAIFYLKYKHKKESSPHPLPTSELKKAQHASHRY